MTHSNSLARLWRKSSSAAEHTWVGVCRHTRKVRFHYRLLSVLYRSESGTLPHPIWEMCILKLYQFCKWKVEGRPIQKNNSGPALQNWETWICCMAHSNSLARLWRKSSSAAEHTCVGVCRYTPKIRFHYRLQSVLYRSESSELPHPLWEMWILKLYWFCA